jgi:glycosyltransferase involved in cell wall biosynthesis
MSKAPLVSVIIPNYNHASHLKRRIDTVLNQTFTDFEVIILDDCSADGSREIIESYRTNSKIAHIILNEVNSGSPFLQWRKGIELANGEWVWIAESDDYADLNFLQVVLSSLGSIENLGLIYCDSAIVVENELKQDTFGTIKNKNLTTNRWQMNHTNSGLLEIENYVLPYGSINNTSAVLFNKNILNRVNPFDIAFRFIGDKYAFIKVLSVSNVAYINKALNYFRSSPDGGPKHTRKFIYYFYEQFLIFDWVQKNLKTIDKNKFLLGLYRNTEVSLVQFNKERLTIFYKLIKLNPVLFFYILKRNFIRTIMSAWK